MSEAGSGYPGSAEDEAAQAVDAWENRVIALAVADAYPEEEET